MYIDQWLGTNFVARRILSDLQKSLFQIFQFSVAVTKWEQDALPSIATWNPNDLYFWRSTPQNKAFSNQNKGHLGSRYTNTFSSNCNIMKIDEIDTPQEYG